MTAANEIVNVSISLVSVNPSREAFGTGMFVAYHTANSDLVRSYSDLPSVAVDFPSTTSTVYQAAAEYFGDNPAPATLKIGRRTHTSLQVLTLNCLSTDSALVAFTCQGKAISVTSSTTTALSAAAIGAAVVSATLSGVTSTVTGSAVVITSATSGQILQFSGWNRAQIDPELTTTTASNLTADLNAILAADSDFYAFAVDSQTDNEIVEGAAWARTTALKEFFFDTIDGKSSSTSTGNLLATLKGTTESKTCGLVQAQNSLAWSGVALMAQSCVSDPGSYTLDMRALPGITPDNWNATEAANIKANNGNLYRTIAGLNVVTYGTNIDGSFEDDRRFIDWLQQEIQTRLISLFASASKAKRKIPYTTKGIRLVAATIQGALTDGVRNGGFSDDPDLAPYVIVPAIGDVAASDLTARNLPNVKFVGTLAGAIQRVTVVGTVGGA
mgnify:CR=1 FL=1